MAGEFDLIARYAPKGAVRQDVLLGSGDDAALMQVPSGKVLVSTVDTLVSGRHFPEDTDAYDVGWKSLAVNLSDLAAMGAEATWVTIALTLPAATPDREVWMADFCRGIQALAEESGVAVVGGDLTSGPLSITIQAMGLVNPDHALRRDGAQVGDVIAVSGTLGDAALALHLLQNGHQVPDILLNRLNRPEPRLALGQLLAGRAHAALDISDGLLGDLEHMLAASGVGATLQASGVPRSESFDRHCPANLRDSLALSGGDDYELCVCLPVSELVDGLTVIGQIEAEPGCRVLDAGGEPVKLAVHGFDHFESHP